MEFTFETAYDQKALTVMAMALRKTTRKKRNRRSRIFGAIVILLAVVLALPFREGKLVLTPQMVITWLVAAILVLVLLFEDRINGYIARKRMLPGLQRATVTFSEEGYHSETELGSSEFKYGNIVSIAESADYFVLAFSASHAQVYDKRSISGGSVDEFRAFIKSVTGKEISAI